MILLPICYIVIVVCIFLWISKKQTLYIYSPFLLIYFSFITNDIIPYLFSSVEIPVELSNVLYVSCCINLFFLFCYRKQLSRQVVFEIPKSWRRFANKRRIILFVFFCMILLAGYLSGVTANLLCGNNIESLRRESEIGLGVIRTIPTLGIQILFLVIFLNKGIEKYKKTLFCSFLIGLCMFITTGNKSGFQIGVFLFLVFFHAKYRGFRWYEYCLFYMAIPIGAGILQGIRRGGGVDEILAQILVFLVYPTIIFDINTVPIINAVLKRCFFGGQEYWESFTTLIPRFLWPEKPISFDYKLKELVGYDFEGGGIYTTLSNNLLINLGQYWIVGYILYLFVIHHLYGLMLKSRISCYYKLAVIFLITSGSLSSLIKMVQYEFILLLFLVLFYRRRKTL